MSSRQMRRLREKMEAAKKLEKKESDSEDDFEPLYVNKQKASYDLLSANVSAENENEPESDILKDTNDSFLSLRIDDPDSPDEPITDDDTSSDELPAPVTGKKNKKSKHKKRERRKRGQLAATFDSTSDEVELALAEVNSILGTPEAPSRATPRLAVDFGKELIQVNHKFLNPDDELTRRFGPDDEEGKKHQRPNLLRLLKRQIILPDKDYTFFLNGITMQQINEKDGVKYFQLVHNLRYQQNVRGVISAVKKQLASMGPPDYDIFNLDSLEALLQNVDLYFLLEEATWANNALESAINFLQNNFCSSFRYCDGKSILRYEIVENRPFHIILLKYLHLLTNKACHRTALEVAKLLLNLDPSDPLGVIFIVDTIALRAREHQWLCDIYMVWSEEKNAGQLFHLQYSHALARYHIYLKSKDIQHLRIAENYIMEAMIMWPNVTPMLFAHCMHACPEVTNHQVFLEPPVTSVSPAILELQKLYVAFAGPKWREGTLIQWLSSMALRICNKYDTTLKVKMDCITAANTRRLLFKEHPIEIKRYLFVIRSMSNLIVEGAVPTVKDTYAFNPYPLQGDFLDRHGYFAERLSPEGEDISNWRAFLDSLVPMAP